MEPEWTVQQLQARIEEAASERLHCQVVAFLELPISQTMRSLGLHGDDTWVTCSLAITPRLFRCEPPFGTTAGGTRVTIRGTGFLAGLGFGCADSGTRVSFGPGQTVACWRLSDQELQCITPQHPEGITKVSLVGCETARDSGAAAYEFMSEGRMCDMIFLTTNANCPIRQPRQGLGEDADATPFHWPDDT